MNIIMYYHCNIHKSFDSMGFPEAMFPETPSGRAKLLAYIKKEIAGGTVDLPDGQTMEALEDAVLNSKNVMSINDYVDYGYVCVGFVEE